MHGSKIGRRYKNEEGRRFNGVVTSYLAGDIILAGGQFWAKILPEGIVFDDFVRLYHQAIEDIGMKAAIRDMADNLVPANSPVKERITEELANVEVRE